MTFRGRCLNDSGKGQLHKKEYYGVRDKMRWSKNIYGVGDRMRWSKEREDVKAEIEEGKVNTERKEKIYLTQIR